jgi:hypothetical protein
MPRTSGDVSPIECTRWSPYSISSTGLIRHSSGIISFDVALTSGSQVKIFRMNRKNWSFSCPGGIVVTKSSREVFGTGGSETQFPVIAFSEE